MCSVVKIAVNSIFACFSAYNILLLLILNEFIVFFYFSSLSGGQPIPVYKTQLTECLLSHKSEIIENNKIVRPSAPVWQTLNKNYNLSGISTKAI